MKLNENLNTENLKENLTWITSKYLKINSKTF